MVYPSLKRLALRVCWAPWELTWAFWSWEPTPVLRSRCLMAGFCAMTMTKSLFQPLTDKKFNELPQHSGARRTDVSVDNSDIQSLLSGLNRALPVMIHWNAKPTPGLILAIGSPLQQPYSCCPCFDGGTQRPLVAILMTDAAPSNANTLENFWSTADQKGAKALAEGDAARAATLFEAPDWRGTAHYEAGDFRSSSAEFGKLDSADALYNRGNALALSGDFQGAIDSYDKSLEAEPDRQDAIDNRELVKSLLEQQQQEQQGNDQDSNSDQSDQEGESQDSESDSSQQEQDSSESQEGSSDPSDQQPSDQESSQAPTVR